MNNCKLVLENGKVFEGKGFGYEGEVVAELVFNTAVVGYQEILSDPSYYGQMVCMTYPIIGTYGMTDEDYESKNVVMSGLIVREYNDIPSNFRYTRTLSEVMVDNKVVGIEGIDTRELTRYLLNNGNCKAMICSIDKPLDECLSQIAEFDSLDNALAKVSTKKVWYSRTANPKYNVVTIDCGVRLNLIKKLNQAGCNVVVVPYNTTVEEIFKYKPNGLFVSNGPGNPELAVEAIEAIKKLKGKMPILGIELGMCIVALAYGAKLEKLRVGHHGANNPVKNIKTGKIDITSQNHTYTIDMASLENTELKQSHVNVLSNEVAGVSDEVNKVIAVNYNPETGAGISDDEFIISQFVELMGGKR